jgi:hypothetical protein
MEKVSLGAEKGQGSERRDTDRDRGRQGDRMTERQRVKC